MPNQSEEDKSIAAEKTEDVEMEKEKTQSLCTNLSTDQEMLMITYGKAAPAYVKDCLRMENNA